MPHYGLIAGVKKPSIRQTIRANWSVIRECCLLPSLSQKLSLFMKVQLRPLTSCCDRTTATFKH